MSTGSGKQYVSVQATHYPDGNVVPITIMFPGGKVFHVINPVLQEKAQGSSHATKTFSVIIDNQKTRLFVENKRWFVVVE